MKWNRKAIIAISLALFSSSIFARDDAGTGPSPFVDCGIGAALFPDTHWAAVTSNIIWDVGTTALTSATASPETCNGKDVVVAQFIQHSYDNLIENTAKAEGEYITAMLDIYSCNTGSRSAITTALRTEVSKEISKESYVEMSKQAKIESYYEIVNSTITSDFSESCTVS